MSAQQQLSTAEAGTQILSLENLPEKWLCLLFSKLPVKDLKILKLVNSSFERKVSSLDERMQHCTINVFNGKNGQKVKSLLDVLHKAKAKPHNDKMKIKFWFNNSISSKNKKLILTNCSTLVVGLNTLIIENDDMLHNVSTPNLTSLHIRLDKRKRNTIEENAAKLINANSGSLQSLHFFSINRANLQIEKPFLKLTYIQFYRCSAGFIADMLHLVKETVISVKIETCYRLADLIPALHNLVIPNLQHLYLEECDVAVFNLMLPSMGSLKCVVLRECEDEGITQIPDLPNLTTLWIDKVDQFGSKILVKCCKTLECLIVEKSNWRLMPKKIKCPKLKHLMFSFQFAPDTDFVVKHKSTLETLMMSFGYDFNASSCIDKCIALKTLANLTPEYDKEMEKLNRNDIIISKKQVVPLILSLTNSSVIDKFEISSWIIENNEDDESNDENGGSDDDFSDATDESGHEDGTESEDEDGDDSGVNDCTTT